MLISGMAVSAQAMRYQKPSSSESIEQHLVRHEHIPSVCACAICRRSNGSLCDVHLTGEAGVVDGDRQLVEALRGDDRLEIAGEQRCMAHLADAVLWWRSPSRRRRCSPRRRWPAGAAAQRLVFRSH